MLREAATAKEMLAAAGTQAGLMRRADVKPALIVGGLASSPASRRLVRLAPSALILRA